MRTEADSPQHALDALAALDALGLRRRTGKLSVLSNGEAYGFYLNRGRLLMACSSWTNLRLGRTLVRRGAVQGDRLEHGLLRQTAMLDQHGIGSVLVDDGALTREELVAAIEEQCISIMERVLELPNATYYFDDRDAAPSHIEPVSLDTNAIVDAAIRRLDERRILGAMQRLMPPPTARMTLAARIAEVALELSDDELSVAIAINRRPQTLVDLHQLVPFDILRMQRVIISLRERGLLDIKDAG